MYFTDDKKLQRFEREMKIVPNFERKEVWEYADSCNECKNYECKLESCMEAHCPYLKRKIRSNSIITRDLVETFLVDNPYIPFAHRVINMLAKYKGNKLFYDFKRVHSMVQKYDPGKEFPELLIANYDLHEKAKNFSWQIDLFTPIEAIKDIDIIMKESMRYNAKRICRF